MKLLIALLSISLLTAAPAKSNVYVYGGGVHVGTIQSSSVNQVISFSTYAEGLKGYLRLVLRGTVYLR